MSEDEAVLCFFSKMLALLLLYFTMQFLIRVLSLKYDAFKCKLAVEERPLAFTIFCEKKNADVNLKVTFTSCMQISNEKKNLNKYN